MKRYILFFSLFILNCPGFAQCKYQWAKWNDIGVTDSATGYIISNGATINLTMTANYNFDFTPNIFGYYNFNNYPDAPTDTVVPRSTWGTGAGQQTTICFSQPVVNPVLLLSSLGNITTTVVLDFSIPYNGIYNGGGTTFTTSTSLTAVEGYCIIEFPGTFSCVTIYTSTPEYYTNLTWGMKNPLNAEFTYTQGCPGSPVNFTSQSTINLPGTINSYDWDFGDGNFSSLQNPSHQYSSAGPFNTRLIVTSDNLCQDTIIHSVNLNILNAVNNQQTICNGTSYNFNSHQYNNTGIYYDTLTSSSGCDSVIITDLTIRPPILQTNNISICSGQNYIFNSHTYHSTGIYSDTLVSVTGCDSIISTHLTINAPPVNLNPVSICPGANYSFNSHTYSSPGHYNDTLTTSLGCDSIITTMLSFYNLPVITFSPPPDICINSSPVILNANPPGGIYRGNGITNNYFDPQSTGTGAYELSYIFLDTNECIDTTMATVNVRPLPIPEFSTNPPLAYTDYPFISFTDLTVGAVTWLWDFGDSTNGTGLETSHTYHAKGFYTVTLYVTNFYNCEDNVTHEVEIRDNFSFYVANTFTPNNDGVNDLFNGQGSGIIQYNMRIYDRWGIKVFETNSLSDSWSAENYPNDSYVYKIVLTDLENIKHEYTGLVSVVR